jgi:hypothetical protein
MTEMNINCENLHNEEKMPLPLFSHTELLPLLLTHFAVEVPSFFAYLILINLFSVTTHPDEQ